MAGWWFLVGLYGGMRNVYVYFALGYVVMAHD